MDRRITRSLASRVKDSDEQNVRPPEPSSTDVQRRSKKKKVPTVSKYHYEYDMWGRRKRVPNRDHSKQAEVENMMVIPPPEQKQISCGQGGDDYASKQRTKTSSTSSPRKRKASQSAANNTQVKMEGVAESGKLSSSNAHQRNSCSHPQAKVNSNISDGQVVVKKEKIGNNHCAKQQYEQQQLVPKSSSRSSNNHRNQVVHQHHHVLNEATNISKQPASNKMIPVTITITSDSSEISESKQRQQQLAMVQRQQLNVHQNLAINNNSMLLHLDLPSSSNRVMMNTEVGTTGIATGSSPSVSSFDDEDIPEASVDFPKGILSTIKCNGCNKDFFTLDHVPKSDYYFHCFQCPEYCSKSKFDLFLCNFINRILFADETSRCYDCYSYFIDNESKERHYTLFHSVKACKPTWMPPSMYTKSTLHRSNARIECRGCAEPFGCFVSPISQSSTPSLEYYIHCIEDCSDYKRLQLIATCNTCGFKFMESKSLAGHKPHCTRIFEKGLNLSTTTANSSCCPMITSSASGSVPASLMSSLHVSVSNLNHYQQQAANHR